MRYFKLGNTWFQTELIQGCTKQRRPQGVDNTSYKWDVIVFLNSSTNMRQVGYPCKTEEEALKLIEVILEGGKVIDAAALIGDSDDTESPKKEKGPEKLDIMG